jgi:hypothetical protein
MKNQLVQVSALIFILSPLVACSRVPVGAFGVAGSGGSNAISVDAGSNTLEERKLTKLKQIDQKIQDGLDHLTAILDPSQTTEPANLDKLVVGDAIDPSLSYDRRFSANQKIEQKLDAKAQDLISGSVKATTVSTSPDTSADPSLLNDRSLRNQAEIDKSLNDPLGSDTNETAPTSSKSEKDAASDSDKSGASIEQAASSDTQETKEPTESKTSL